VKWKGTRIRREYPRRRRIHGSRDQLQQRSHSLLAFVEFLRASASHSENGRPNGLRQRIKVERLKRGRSSKRARPRPDRLTHEGVGWRIFHQEIATASKRAAETQDSHDARKHARALSATSCAVRG
jgi:hypothetical protein